MNIEGAVKLGYRNELAAIEDPEERRIQYDVMVAESYENAKALHAASYFGIDDVIDPASDDCRLRPQHFRQRPQGFARPPVAGRCRALWKVSTKESFMIFGLELHHTSIPSYHLLILSQAPSTIPFLQDTFQKPSSGTPSKIW